MKIGRPVRTREELRVGKHYIEIIVDDRIGEPRTILVLDSFPCGVTVRPTRLQSIDAAICNISQHIESMQAIKKELEAEYQRSLNT